MLISFKDTNIFSKLKKYTSFLIFFLFLIVLIFPLFNKEAVAQSTAQVYWGAYIRGSAGNPTYPADYSDVPYDMRTLDLFETNAGKRVSIVHFAQPWKNSSGNYVNFPQTLMTNIRGRGVIPMLNWGSWQLGQGVNQPAFKLSKITRGDYDSYIGQFARDAKAWGKPFFLRFNHEMNIGGQFSWNFSDTWTDSSTGTTYRNTPADFINMWRHVVDIFRREGATNVTWVWCPNIYFRSGSNALPFMQGYPGDEYVDWNCLDGYNKSTNMTPFSSLFSDSYNVLQQRVTGTDTTCNSLVQATSCNPARKPIMIGEWASIEAGDGGTKKANWIRDSFLTQLPNYFPAIKAVVWFNWETANGLIIESTPTANSAFKNSIASSYYSSNNYGNITNSPIPPIGTTSASITPTLPLPTASADGTYISDSFSRTLSGSWGNADTGGIYTYSPVSGVLNFRVNGSEGIMTIPSAGNQLSALLHEQSQRDADIKTKVKIDKLPSGGLLAANLEARKSVAGSYRMVLRYETDKLFIQAQKYLSSTGLTTDLSAKQELTGITYVANNYYWIRGQINGVNPTAIKIKVWHSNSTEPVDWQYSVTDSSATQLIQGGSFGLLSRVGTGNTSLPVTFTYDEYKVSDPNRVVSPTPTPILLGDADFNNIVDENDYQIWKSNYGRSTANGARDGDFNSDGKVNSADHILWLKNYNN